MIRSTIGTFQTHHSRDTSPRHICRPVFVEVLKRAGLAATCEAIARLAFVHHRRDGEAARVGDGVGAPELGRDLGGVGVAGGLEDQRASGTVLINVSSKTHWQGRLDHCVAGRCARICDLWREFGL